MNFIKTEIDGVIIVEPRVFEDARGYFFESYNQKEFIAVLEKRGINVTVRRKMGADIDAACGQLRRKHGGQE